MLDQMPEWQPLGAYTKFHGLMPMDLKRRQKMPTMAYQTWAEHIKGDSPELAAILLASPMPIPGRNLKTDFFFH